MIESISKKHARVSWFRVIRFPLDEQIAALQRAEILILVFPTWWFGPPALLKGWFDRVWAPGFAFNRLAKPGERITPKLAGLRHCLVVTTLGGPWWFDRLIEWRPLRRVLKKVLIGTCAPAARFDRLSLYSAISVEQPRLDRFFEPDRRRGAKDHPFGSAMTLMPKLAIRPNGTERSLVACDRF